VQGKQSVLEQPPQVKSHVQLQVAKKPSSRDDRRSRKDLEAFLLALIARGLKTPYDFMTSAGISPGASIPALGRLESAGYVRKGEGGARNRQEYEATGKGQAFLEQSWREIFQAPPTGDLDTVIRTASLALLMSEPKRSVAAYLGRAAALRKARRSVRLTAVPTHYPAGVFLWMRQVAAAGRAKNEATTLRELASAIQRLR
jgi:DNA-binding PadR family transcriptional regulator